MIEALIICLWSIVANGNDTSGLLVYLGYVSGTNFTLINGVFPFKVMVKKICEILAGKHQFDFVPKRNFIFVVSVANYSIFIVGLMIGNN